MEQIHCEISNPHYGYKGIHPLKTTICQSHLDREFVPTKYKLRKKKKEFQELVENGDVNGLCEECCKAFPKKESVDQKLSFYISKLSENSLLKILFEKTEELKVNYFLKTKEYTKNYFEFLQSVEDLKYDEWVKKFPMKSVFRGEERIVLNRQGDKFRTEVYNTILPKGYQNFEDSEMDHALNHYISSVEKLHNRLNEKGIIDGLDIKISNEKIKENLEMTIKSGSVVVRAWTIIAEGPIQRPHYRYLIK